ncbi:MAG: hypothetical protein IPJ82_04675 [Lewinellaceae bacterium]|nr:hypothetical protein [Lewinellaceae bacterium]
MKKFILRTALFLLPVPFLLVLSPLDRGFAWRFVKGDCYTHGAWLWNRLYIRPEPVDVAFSGSSRTIHAVWEKSIADSLSIYYDQNRQILNMGYCRFGNNFPYLAIKELLETKRPEIVVWELRETEDCCSHPMFGYLAEGEDVWAPAAFPHRRIFSDWWNAAAVRVEYAQSLLTGDENATLAIDTSLYGYGADAGTADPALLSEIKAKKEAKSRKRDQEGEINEFARCCLEQTVELIHNKGAQLVFLYIPEFGSPETSPQHLSYFQNLGPVWLPPGHIVKDPANWMDATHLNNRGAAALAGWLARQIHELE